MKLLFELPKSDIRELIRTNLHFILLQSPNGKAVINKTPGSIEALGPLPLYNSEIDPQTHSVTVARRIGWRFILAIKDEVMGVADVLQDKKNGAALSSILYGDSAIRLAKGLLVAEKNLNFACKVRLLRIPQLHIYALWLCGKSSKYLILRDSVFPPQESLVGRKKFMSLISSRYAECKINFPNNHSK